MNKVPPFNLTRQYQTIAEEISAAVQDVLTSGCYIGGSLVERFEQQFAQYTGVSDSVACNSGTDALYLALRALQIGPGDEVITTPFTFIATAEVISVIGAKPVFVDIDAKTFNLDIAKLEAAITKQTKAIIPVHLFGQPVDMTTLMAIASEHKIAVIEDSAQAVGAEWAGQKVGSIGHIGCFSFYPTKNLGACGDGGAVTTNDPVLASRIRMLREHGMSRVRYRHEETGINSRLDALQAAILEIKLRYLDQWNNARSEIAAKYQELLQPLPGVVIPQEASGGRAVWNQYTIRLTKDGNDGYRDKVRDQLQQLGISSTVYYPLPLHLQPVYQDLGYQVGQLPIAEQACHEVLSLPMFPELSFEEQQQVVYGLKDCIS
ncbi:Aminotransferase, DegT/DnrJ/EryC1/StrS family [uncultured Coleofasciculus sp.]|uniref:Aminotransferase, DegT/DnrJ/EryC1/StrS family n=1 Tax=uncultured Coleofasciculus sp. TaxID=1267456 RepID=A0A6J4K3M5_9CYAN|nr:Aminotransferase, DegT/DnrJ/EryC1/StrS family [uncultured Coleofasciculus sp.]